MKLFANQGDIELQAQNANLAMAAKQDIKVDSVDGNITLTADKEITLICGGSYIKINSEGIELGTAGNLRFKSAVLQKMGPVSLNLPSHQLPLPATENAIKFHFIDEYGTDYINQPYIAILPDGTEIHGITDKEGKTQQFYTETPDLINVHLIKLV
jgi:type VI secretion system secreted protein VgrG